MKADKRKPKGHVTFETAARHATTDIPVFTADHRADRALQEMVGKTYVSASHVIVCREQQFLGVVRIERLLTASGNVTLGELMDRDAPVVAPGVDQEVAAWHAVRNAESALAVVDGNGRFVGLIPPHRLLAVLLSEHEEDLSHFGGFTRSKETAADKAAATIRAINVATSVEPVERSFRHRLPWLLVGLIGALLAADFVGWFEAHLREKVMLAFFIPGIVYLADAVGTQTETVVVRGLSVGVSMRRMVRRELLSGLAIGVALGLVAGPLVWWHWGEADVALSVGLSVFAACSTASVAAMAMPWLLDSLSLDPAFGSGPLATVVQDLLSILIYFGIATALVR